MIRLAHNPLCAGLWFIFGFASLGSVACDGYEVVPSIAKQAASKRSSVNEPTAGLPPAPSTPTIATQPADEADSSESTPPSEPTRDLPAELAAAYGRPTECLSPGSVEGGRTTMRLSVVVTSAGRVTRASLTAPVDRESRRCLIARAERVQLAAPIEGAPRTVGTNVELVSPPAVEEPETGRRLPEGTVPAAQVLPARGGPSRDTSFIPPVTTLPAMVPAQRPEGFVAPQTALPPRGETGSSRPIQDD